MKYWIIAFFLFLISVVGEAQDKGKISSEWSVHTGPYLPDQIAGITEILPMWGMRYGWNTGKSFLEIGGMHSRSEGVLFYNTSISLRGDMPIQDLWGTFFVGADANIYKPVGGNTFLSVGGMHLGAGMMSLLADVTWFRADMRFNFNPGVALYFSFGFNLRFP